MRRLLLIACSGLVLAACGSSGSPYGSASTTSTDAAGFAAPYPSVRYPLSDPTLPSVCKEIPDQHWSSEVGTSHLQRVNGGVIEFKALAVAKADAAFVDGEIGYLDAFAGNCFYSSNVVQQGTRFEMVFGFKRGAGPMDPSAVAHYLRLQRFAFSSVTGPSGKRD